MLPTAAGGVLVASPSDSVREQVRRSLDDGTWPVQEVNGGADALAKLESGQWQLLFLDRRLPDLDAEELIQIIQVRFPGIEVVIVDSDGGPIAPRQAGRFRSWCKMPLPRQRASEPAFPSEDEDTDTPPLPGMVGRSAAMQRLYRLTRLVAPRNTTVLILGETGTGKELVARAIHQLSPRAGGPWAVVNCAAIPEALLESELFGYARGAFTGAVQSYAGRIHAAQGGTLFLDEVGELSLGMQAKLLRFLELKEIQRLGSLETMRVDIRVIAATNSRLERQVEAGSFRRDLYYRLSAFPLHLPPLAARRDDILPLAEHFLRQLSGGPGGPQLSAEAQHSLQSQEWSGNVRELQQVMERAIILAEGSRQILPEHLGVDPTVGSRPNAEKIAGGRRP